MCVKNTSVSVSATTQPATRSPRTRRTSSAANTITQASPTSKFIKPYQKFTFRNTACGTTIHATAGAATVRSK